MTRTMKSRMIARLGAGLLSFAAGLTLAAPGGGPPGAGGPPPPPPKVSSVKIEERTVPIIYEVAATTQASKIVEVRARIRGFVAKRHFREGQQVKEGDVLYTIDKVPFEADLEIAAATLEQAEARFAYAEREYNRIRKLFENAAVSEGDVDRALNERDQARASVRLAKAKLEKARLDLGYTEVKAPATGVVGKAEAEEGAFVDDMNHGLMTEVMQTQPLYVSMRVSEREFLKWRQGVAEGSLRQPADGQETYQIVLTDGTVFDETGKTNYEAAAFRQETGTFELRAEFPNAKGMLKPGQFVKARIAGFERPGTIAVPQRAVHQTPAGQFVYTVGTGSVVEYRPVTVGDWTGTDWVLTSGVKAGETVLVEGFLKVQPGMPVEPVPYVPGQDPSAAMAPPAGAPGAGK